MLGFGEPTSTVPADATTAIPHIGTELNPTPQMIAERKAQFQAVNSEMMDGMEDDAKLTGRYFAVFGQKTPTEDQRIIVLTQSATEIISGQPLFTMLTREGSKSLSLKSDQADKLKMMVNNQIKLAYEDPSSLAETTKGGLTQGPDGLKLVFGDNTKGSSLTFNDKITLLLDSKTFLESIVTSRNQAENPNKRKYDLENARLTQAQQTRDAFKALISRSPSQQLSNGQNPTV